jgi:hypothetical protein
MRTIKGLWYFYQKLIVPSLAISVVLALLTQGFGSLFFGVGFSYAILAPLVHWYSYEINSPDEYYFYYNLGLNKRILWANTVAISMLILLILLVL